MVGCHAHTPHVPAMRGMLLMCSMAGTEFDFAGRGASQVGRAALGPHLGVVGRAEVVLLMHAWSARKPHAASGLFFPWVSEPMSGSRSMSMQRAHRRPRLAARTFAPRTGSMASAAGACSAGCACSGSFLPFTDCVCCWVPLLVAGASAKQQASQAAAVHSACNAASPPELCASPYVRHAALDMQPWGGASREA